MRTAFIEELTRQASEREDIFLVVGDLGFSVVEDFAARFPGRFLNVGVAEQNMTGIAAGLASEGYHVFTYSIANFPTLRCLEQIRNDVCYHGLPVTIVAVGAGLAYGNLGYSHHGVQDIACLRGFPGLSLHSPADPGETRQIVDHLVRHPGPSYLRLGKAGEQRVHDMKLNPGMPVAIRSSAASIAVAATGSVVGEALAAADLLAAEGTEVDLYSFHALSSPVSSWAPLFEGYRAVLTVEEHVAAGGFGELFGAAVSRRVEVEHAAVDGNVLSTVGSQSYLRELAGLDARSLANRLRSLARAFPVSADTPR